MLPDEFKEIKEVATSFHRWYMASIKNFDANSPIDISIVEGEDGKCKVDYEPYFTALRRIGTISELFIENEKERFGECDQYISNVDWEEYQQSNAYEYDKHCAFLYYYFWIRSHELMSGVEAGNVEKISEHHWNVELRLFEGEVSDSAYWPYLAIAEIAEIDGELLINKISWIED